MVDHQWKASQVLLSEAKKERESFCLTSTGTKLFIRDGDKEGRGRNSEGSIAGANPEDQDAVDRRQNKNVKAESLALAQQLVYYAADVSNAVRNRVTKTMSVAPLLTNNGCGRSPTVKPSSTSLLLISSGLT